MKGEQLRRTGAFFLVKGEQMRRTGAFFLVKREQLWRTGAFFLVKGEQLQRTGAFFLVKGERNWWLVRLARSHAVHFSNKAEAKFTSTWWPRLNNSEHAQSVEIIVGVVMSQKWSGCVTVICVPPWRVFPRTYNSRDICSPTQGQRSLQNVQ